MLAFENGSTARPTDKNAVAKARCQLTRRSSNTAKEFKKDEQTHRAGGSGRVNYGDHS